MLKKRFDWMSRRRDIDPCDGCVMTLISASPGGLRGLAHPRQGPQTLNMQANTEQFALSRAHQAFDTDARVADSRHAEQVTRVVQRRIDIAHRLE
jgi:NAD(P)H-dependent FMN reductase